MHKGLRLEDQLFFNYSNSLYNRQKMALWRGKETYQKLKYKKRPLLLARSVVAGSIILLNHIQIFALVSKYPFTLLDKAIVSATGLITSLIYKYSLERTNRQYQRIVLTSKSVLDVSL